MSQPILYSLPNWTEGTIYNGLSITWKDSAGTAVDLTGATITGRLYNTTTKTATDIAGTLTPDADQVTNTGLFTWTMVSGDVAAGNFHVQFIATYSGDPAKTFKATWYVEAAIPAP